MTTPRAVFEAALREMSDAGRETYGPIPFQTYLESNGLPEAGTAATISVDSYDRLSPELKAAGAMVFRLGSRPGAKGTHFGLAKWSRGVSDYFLEDEELLKRAEPQPYLPNVSARRLFAFQLLPRLTESSYVNLAICSGLLQHALGISEDHEQVVPATGQSTFTFDISPRPGMTAPWQHVRGQVEIDAIFTGRRNGKESLFVVEAKTGLRSDTLAKHKLCYPIAALRTEVPAYLPIVPVYLKTWHDGEGLHFLVSECAIAPGLVVVSELKPVAVHHLVLHGFEQGE